MPLNLPQPFDEVAPMETPPVQTRQILSFTYPKSNQVNCRQPHFRRRTIYVTKIRDVGQGGLSPVTIKKRPMLNRGRWLITGICLESGQERSFYFEAMQEFQRPTWYTLGLSDPMADGGPDYCYGRFAPTAQDRQRMFRIIELYGESAAEDDDNEMVIGVFPC